MNTQLNELQRLLAAVDSNMCSAEAQLLIRDSRRDIEHGRRSIAKAIKIVDALDSQQVQGVILNGTTAFGELPPSSGKEQTCDPLLSAAHDEWLPMATAPTDGTLVRLLVQFKEHSIDDGEGPFPTIGFNNVENDNLDEWQFAGWCWGHDHFTTGEGTPVGWLPLHSELAPGDEPTAPEALATKLIDTWCATHGGQIPWEKAVEITSIATSMSTEERERLLAMADTPTDQGPDTRPTLAYSVRGNRYLVTATRGEIGEPYTDAQIIELVERNPLSLAARPAESCTHVFTDDGMFTVDCTECGLRINAEPSQAVLEQARQEAFEAGGDEHGCYTLDGDELDRIVANACAMAVIDYAAQPKREGE